MKCDMIVGVTSVVSADITPTTAGEEVAGGADAAGPGK